ncbi:MAG: radical SAM protein [Planctomycetota bacterium]
MLIALHKPLLRRQYHMEYRYYCGFGYLKAYLQRQLPQVEVRIVHDEADIRAAQPDIVGFSTVTEMWPHLLGVYERLRMWFEGPVLFGGSHISALPQLLPLGDNIAFIGEGEIALTRVLERMLAGAGLTSDPIPGTAWWRGGHLVHGPAAELVDINALPAPADAPTDVFPLTTVRGCPYHCSHCVERPTQGRPRQMSAERLAELVIERYEQHGTTTFELLDDIFLVSPRRLHKFVDLLAQRGLLERFEFIRLSLMAHLLTDEVARTLARMNIRLAGMGVESADPEILAHFKNGVVTRAHLERAIRACTKHGVGIGSSMVLGYPGETERQLRNTIEFYAENIHRTALEFWEPYVCQPLPGSTLWHRALQAGRVAENMDFSTLRIDADVAHFDTPWYYDNEQGLPRARFLEVLREFDLIRDGFFVRDLSNINATPKTDVFVRQYAPESVSRRMTLQALRAWQTADGRPVAVFGAGKHTRKVLPALLESPVSIAAIVDDDPNRQGLRLGRWEIIAPARMADLDIGAVLVSSDMRQQELVARLRPLVADRYRLLTIYQAEEAVLGCGNR